MSGIEIEQNLVAISNLVCVAWLIRVKDIKPVKLRRGKRGGEWLFKPDGLKEAVREFHGDAGKQVRAVLEEIKLQKESLSFL